MTILKNLWRDSDISKAKCGATDVWLLGEGLGCGEDAEEVAAEDFLEGGGEWPRLVRAAVTLFSFHPTCDRVQTHLLA